MSSAYRDQYHSYNISHPDGLVLMVCRQDKAPDGRRLVGNGAVKANTMWSVQKAIIESIL